MKNKKDWLTPFIRLKKIGELIGSANHTDHAIFLLGEFLRLNAVRQMIF